MRYDFNIPFEPASHSSTPHHFHDALTYLYETSSQQPYNAFLRPFIADPPTTTESRLKGLTTGTLPTFIDAGSNFGGSAINEDNLIEQLYKSGKRIVQLGDDTWHSLFSGYFEPNLTKPFDSFNVWDLHTVDNGVNEHLFPLLQPGATKSWDVIIAHYLGVDHAGHRYGPDHPAMAEKLRQMDQSLRDIVAALDDKTLLVVMGDHGMDVKGDHGGESDDEVEATIWMYSKTKHFGRSKEGASISATAKQRPVSQVDIVPTLALLLGIPIPYNNLGKPIEEAFIGTSGKDYRNLARVNRITNAQIERYRQAYMDARRLDDVTTISTHTVWQAANEIYDLAQSGSKTNLVGWQKAYDVLVAFQGYNLQLSKAMWASFDFVLMGMGITVLTASLCIIAVYGQGFSGDRAALTPPLVGYGFLGLLVGALAGSVVSSTLSLSFLSTHAFSAAVGSILALSYSFLLNGRLAHIPIPSTMWGVLSTLTCLLLCISFASNSFTIWEDEQLLFFLTTFGVLLLGSSLGQEDPSDRMVGTLNSISFILATRLASFSRLCREEQMPFCRSTYYASATSSTSASWQLAIPVAVAIILPTAIVAYYHRTRNYQGSAVIWIGIALRIGLVLVAVFWFIDVADDGEWLPSISSSVLKTTRVLIAQLVLAIAFAAGHAMFIFTAPFLAVKTETVASAPTSTSKPINDTEPNAPILTTVTESAPPRTKLIIMGYANTHGTRYLLLPCAWLLALLLVQKPMGQGTLALCMISIMNLLEVVDANQLHTSALGPTVLALLGSYYYFKTGHQATLSSIQWDTAFIPLKSVRYPWSPLVVMLNTFGAQILCALAVPALSMWKVKPKPGGMLGRVAGAMATHILFYSAIAVATVVEAAWLRRHLMLYRIFMPRMLLASAVLLTVDIVAIFVALMGVRISVISVADVFGWV